ncbi:MAG: acyl-CoA/acyl-ACP dehydrogenase [Deltaproteobacteria bacterium]|nr:acyl-CoA/acyl-ACP dehydrogenase [Deltaproteobacteria bacterium]
MDLSLTNEQKMIQKTAEEFCRQEIDPLAKSIDHTSKIPDKVLKKYKEVGFFGMTVPKKYGGTGAGNFAHLLVIEKLAYSGTSAWWPVAFNNSIPETISRFGTPEQQERYVKSYLDGTNLFSVQFTEPDTGSDPKALLTRSVPDGDGYIIKGSKRFSTFGARPGPAIVWTKDENENCTCFIVEKLADGYSTSKIWDLMGCGGVEAVDVCYENYRVGSGQILGEKGKGLDVLLYWISVEKIEGCIVAVALAQAALDEAIRYTKNRKAGGRPISEMQGIRFELADMYAKIRACRWMTYCTAQLIEINSPELYREAAACKIIVQPLMSQVIETSLRLHGGYGYTKDFKIERLYRAQTGNSVISVSLEINKSIVAASILQ